jgi:hypothetical protein
MSRASVAAAAMLAMHAGLAAPAFAQGESAAHAAFAKEGREISEGCGAVSKIATCIYTFATANPIHLTFGSIAPGNGVAFGPALVGHSTPGETWRINWSADGVAAPGGAWRAGGYLNFVRTAVQAPVVVSGSTPLHAGAPDVYPVYSVFAQAVSLDSLAFYGEGSSPDAARKSFWSMKQTVAGGRAVVPVGPGRAGVALVGGAALRAVRVSGHSTEDVPAIDHEFGPADVPGLNDDRSFLELSAAVAAAPDFGVHIRPLYSVGVDQFIAGRSSHETFTRWTADVEHEFPFYRIARPSLIGNTPNDCSLDDGHTCASPSRNRYGAATVRVLTIGSLVPAANSVPFYLQPTLGGSDINGRKVLSSFDDYFYRAPNAFAVQVTAEHSLFAIGLGHGFALPLGGMVMVEEGGVGDRWSDVFDATTHSFGVGLTVRAGGFPEIVLLYAWGPSGRHVSGTINPALLGSGARPSLF